MIQVYRLRDACHFCVLHCYFSSIDSESASEAASCTSADTMDDSDSSADREATTTCSPAFVRGKLRRRKAPESDFKETRKTKLNGSAAKRFFQKIKQKFTARKLRRNLKKEEVAPLLVEDSCSGSDSGTATIDTGSKQKKSKRTKSKTSAKEKKFNPFSATDARPLLLEEGEESDDESSNCPNRAEGAGQGEEFDEICLDDDVGQIRTRKQQWNKESMEIEEVVSDKKRRQNEARRLRRQKTKVTLIIPSTPSFLKSSVALSLTKIHRSLMLLPFKVTTFSQANISS